MKDAPKLRFTNSPRAFAALLVAVLTTLSGVAIAADSSDYRIVDGLAIYYATVPAEVIRRFSKDSPEAVMHGGIPKGKHVHHIIVALFDSKNMERIKDAKVFATVGEIGFARRKKTLEPFTIAGALTYGNYFNFVKFATYTVDIEVKRPGSTVVVKTRFNYRHH